MPISTATATATTNRSTSNASNASNAFNAPDLPRQESLLFYGDKLTALMDSDGEIFVVMNEILRAIGFDDNKVYNQRKAWGQDAWIQEGTKTLPVLMKNGGMQNTTCLNRRYLPLAIARISLTPTMQREHPEIVDKLKRYQTKCSDVLYEYFFRKQQEKSGKQLGADIPLTREEMAAYFTCLMDTFKGYTAMLDRRDSERETLLTKLVDSQSTFNSTFARYIDRWRSIDAQKAIEILPGKTTTYYTNPYLINTADLAAVETWHNATMSYAAEIGRRSNQTVGLVLTSIFDTIKQKYSVDIAALAHEYWQNTGNANHSYPMLCANSDYLRAKVDEELVELARRYMPEKFTASAVFGGATATEERTVNSAAPALPRFNAKYKSAKLVTTPPAVKSLIELYAARNSLTYPMACRRVYKELNNMLGINIKSLCLSYARSQGCSKCSAAYYIGSNSKLMAALREICAAN